MSSDIRLDRSTDARSVLEQVIGAERTDEAIANGRAEVRRTVLGHAPNLREPQFVAISPRDLAVAFDALDATFFGGAVREAVGRREIAFRIATRATKRGGSFSARRPPGELPGTDRERLEITASATPLFESFREGGRTVEVVGHACADRLDALLRVLEHEVVHLVEHLLWFASDCAEIRFQAMARRAFGHRAFTHALVTPGERAAHMGFRVGQQVAFVFQGARLQGVLNRVTKRATVLVPHPDGEMMSDGRRYLRFYVPLRGLAPAGPQDLVSG